MEEGAVSIGVMLSSVGLPVSLVGIAAGLLTAIRLVPRAGLDLSHGGLLERVAVGLCGGVAMLGLIGTIETFIPRWPDFRWPSVVFAVAIILSGLPAVAWKSRWRGAAEGVATASIATAAIMTGLSIGFLFVPLVILMIWVCVVHLRVAFGSPVKREPRRVDSSP
jgi:hypothetical protein